MKINRYGNISNNPYKQQVNKPAENQQQQVKQDKIQISKEALEMQKNNSVSKERTEKIEQLRKDIESGNYHVDSGKVAKKFFDFWTKS
ncbi:flagellar biosynthesis anti-sigma factor FlgM [Pseudalkalibacillus salsuginis]|uniref:flagellar biosynthesis anti-sigma factor FlgM n=1 Tax=Pseudalkalibacillus salsuginis TaxID=2910972 RepID=UPI001F428D6D|nr:flagellar biosynthesis anti-sigma factor FlgM [Pseudalkalibacillus salsuginis]MCF6410145.1 flagellar biosynthesis anti-sigma factor FlgM [Pseudalkalibacillus salsuginis]